MAQYELGGKIYELPDNLTPEQLEETLTELSFELGLAKRDSAFGYGIDRMQQMAGKGIEAGGRLIGSETVEQFGTGIVEQQEKDIKQGGYRPTYGNDLLSYVGTPDFFGALLEKTLETAPSGGAALVGTAGAATAAFLGAPIIATGIGISTTLGTVGLGIGEAAMEQEEKTGQYSPATSVALGSLIGLLDKFGAGKVIPKDQLVKMSVGEVAEELTRKGYANAALEVTKRAAKKAGIEGATETAQEGLTVAGAAAQGGEYTPRELAGRAFEAGTIGGVMGGGTSLGVDAASGAASALDPSIAGEDAAAAGDFARDIVAIIENNDLNINDLDKTSTKGVREAIDRLHIRYDEEMKQLIRDLKQRLQVKDNDSIELLLDKILARVAYREARNKTKSTVGVEELNAVDRLVGNTSEGQALLSLMRRMNELTRLHNSGYQGGISRITDQFSPIGSTIGYDRGQAAFEKIVRPVASLAVGATNPTIPIAQSAAVLAGRGIDAATGRRNRVARFIRGNVNNQGIDTSNAPSERELARQQQLTQQMQQEQTQRDRELLNTNLFLSGAEPTPNSPQDVLEQSTGLDRDGVIRLLTIISRSTANPVLKRAADMAAESVFTGGQVPDLSPLIREMNKRLDKVPDLGVERVREPVRDLPESAVSLSTETPGYLRGIEDNRAFLSDLQEAVNTDDSLSPLDKSVLQEALLNMERNLGINPADRVVSIVDEARSRLTDKTAADKYLNPYASRITKQQQGGTETLANETPVFGLTPQDFEFYQDNPAVSRPNSGKEWLESNISSTERRYANSEPSMLRGPITANLGSRNTDMFLSTDELSLLPGAMGESRGPGDPNYDRLLKKIQKEGFDPDQTGNKVVIGVNHKGEAYLLEGNTRAAVAKALRIPNIKTEVRYWNGGEMIDGPYKPEAVAARASLDPSTEINESQSLILDQPLENDPMRVSTRVPEGKNALANPLTEDLQVSVEAIKSAPGNKNGTVFERMLKKLNAYEGMKGFTRDNDTIPNERQFIELVKRNLLQLYNSVTPEYRERARKWYAGANRLSNATADRFGLTTPQVAGVMAVLSPQQDWYMNYDIGVRVIDTYLNQQDAVFGAAEQAAFQEMIDTTEERIINQGKDPATAPSLVSYKIKLEEMRGKKLKDLPLKEQAMFVRFWDAANNPNGGSHQIISPEGELVGTRMNEDGVTPSRIRFNGFGMVEKAINIINNGSRETIHNNLGTRHKVRSFYNNILNPFSDKGDVTIDTHAVAAGLLRPLANSDIEVSYNLGTAGEGSKISGTMGSYGVYADAYREAAAEVGVLPREMQSITWEAVRGLFTAGFKTKANKDKVKEIWQRYDNGDITLEEAHGEIYDLAGGINKAAWEGSSPRLDTTVPAQIGDTNQPGVIPGTDGRGVLNDPSGSDGRRASSGTTGVLQQAAESEGTVQSQEPAQIEINESRGFRDPRDRGGESLPKPQALAGSRPASLEEVRDVQRTAVKAIFEIGKPGSPFENGIKDIRTVRALIEALGATFIIAKNISEMNRISGTKSKKGMFTRGFAIGPSSPERLNENKVAVLDGDYVNPKNPSVSMGGPLQMLFVALHEVGHLLEKGYLSFRGSANPSGPENMGTSYYNPIKGATQNANLNNSTIYTDTFRNTIRAMLTGVYEEGKSGTEADNTAIYNEVVNMQTNGVLSMGDQTVAVRDFYNDAEAAIARGIDSEYVEDVVMDMEVRYLQSPPEIAADALALYMFDPKDFKQRYPKTAALIRDSFKENRTVQFFAAPFGSVLAIILANMVVAEREDEEKKGVLGLGSAALTA